MLGLLGQYGSKSTVDLQSIFFFKCCSNNPFPLRYRVQQIDSFDPIWHWQIHISIKTKFLWDVQLKKKKLSACIFLIETKLNEIERIAV